MDVERRDVLRGWAMAGGSGSPETLELLDALDAAEARAQRQERDLDRVIKSVDDLERRVFAERDRLREIRDAAERYRQLCINERNNGVGELEARAELFRVLRRLKP